MKIFQGAAEIYDPDELVHEISWKNLSGIEGICLSFPEDKQLFQQFCTQWKKGIT